MNGNDLTNLIEDYYTHRGIKFPNFHEAMEWVHTEIAEVYELDLDRIGGWTRNNPETKPKFSKEELGKELGDAIMLLIVAGMAEGVDPLKSLEEKIREKMNLGVTIYPAGMNTTTFTGEMTEINPDKSADWYTDSFMDKDGN